MIHLHKNDLPADFDPGPVVAMDTETMGLNPQRDRLCLVQLSAGGGDAHIVQLAQGNYAAPHLKKLLTNPKVTKLFHFARFDMAAITSEPSMVGFDHGTFLIERLGAGVEKTP